MKTFDIGCPVLSVNRDFAGYQILIEVPSNCAPDMGKTIEACKRAFGNDTFDIISVDDPIDRVATYRIVNSEWTADF